MKQKVQALSVCLFGITTAAMAAVTQVPAGANLQQYINNAQPGDTLVLQANATYVGNFTLPNKSGSSYITITSSDLASLPPAGVRVNPSYAPHMPKLVAPAGNIYTAVVYTLAGAHHYNFTGIEFAPSPGQQIWDMIELGANETNINDVPHDFVFDRCYIHGDPNQDAKTGLVFNGINMTAENSYISSIKSTGWDNGAIGGWNGPGPFTITNNYLEASGQNIFWGGATPALQGVIPSDFEISGNYLSKPLSWKQGDPSYAGKPWMVKNLIEFKAGRRIMIEGNVLENCWANAQSGYAAVFTLRTENGNAPWLVLQDITFRNNIVRHVSSVFEMSGEDDLSNYQGHSDTFNVYNNLFYDINSQEWGGSYSTVALVLNAFHNVSITHNTAVDTNVVAYLGGPASPNFTMENNIVPSGYGFIADGMNNAQTVLNTYSPGGVFTANAVVGGNSAYYTPGNYFPANLAAVGFVNPSALNYALASTSPYLKSATDGTALGADFGALTTATANAISGAASGSASSGSSGSTGSGSGSSSSGSSGSIGGGSGSSSSGSSGSTGTARAVSIKFVGTGAAMGASESAGVVAKANWNNATGNNSASALSLVDETGASNGASATWTSDVSWQLPVTDSPGNMRMMRGFIDSLGSNSSIFNVTGLPASSTGYDIYVYTDGDNSASKTATYQLSGSGITTTSVTATDAAGANFSGTFTQANNSAGNYVKFTAIQATAFTITATPGTAGNGILRAPVNGIQVVPH